MSQTRSGGYHVVENWSFDSAEHDGTLPTLERPVTFAAGDPVSLPWAGEAPDLGAFEWGAHE